MLSKLFYFIVLIGVLIFIHEMGHFLFAKWFKVKVLKFSLGFGPRLVGFRKGETEYVISWFPLGGYVKMLGEDPTEEVGPEDKGRAFSDKKIYQRFLIVFAGPLFNLVLPILIYFIYYVSQSHLLPSSVGTVLVGMPAWEQGLRAGDRIVSVNGEPIRYWEDVQEKIASHPGETIRIGLSRQGKPLEEVKIKPRAVTVPGQLGLEKTVGQIGVTPDYQGTWIGVADETSPAGKAGLRTWDQIVAVDGEKVQRWTELKQALFAGSAKERTLTVLRPKKYDNKFIEAQLLEPVTVKLKPEPPGAAIGDMVGRIAGAVEKAGEGLAKWILGAVSERAPPEKSSSTDKLLGQVGTEVGLSSSLDLMRRYLPGPAALIRRGEDVVGRALGAKAPAADTFLRRAAIALSEPLVAFGRAARAQVAWPLLHSLAGLLNRYAYEGLEPAEFFVYRVTPSSVAQAIGMRRGDRVVSLNGEGLTLWREIDQVRRQSPKAQLEIAFIQGGRLIQRKFRQQEKVIVDEYKNEVKRYIFGARNLTTTVFDDKVPNESRFGRAIKRAVLKTGEVIAMMTLGIVRLIEGKISPKTVGGPLMIFDIAGKAAKKGWESFLWIMALISINLGLLNLLPIPVLDGGHLLFLGIEAVKRKPVSVRAREIASLVGLSLLILLMIFAFKNDIERYWKDIVDVFR